MFRRSDQIDGSKLPDQSLCLTFDDGPGRQTLELAQYLEGFGIPATFFVVGKHAEEYREVLPKLLKSGHRIGNHTYDHKTWAEVFREPPTQRTEDELNQAVDQLIRGETVIKEITGSGTNYIRPPGGCCPLDEQEKMVVEKALKYFSGRPLRSFGWKIDEGDYNCWEGKISLEDCARKYMDHIRRAAKGIVLMHDSSCDGVGSENSNKVAELIRLLVPQLRELGYRFADLDSCL